MNQQQLNDLTKRCYEAAKANGWHEQERTPNEFILLIQSEMFECFEAYRKNKYAKIIIENTTQAKRFFNGECEFDKGFFEMCIKDTFEDELADTAIRIFDCAGAFGLNLKVRFYKGGNASFIEVCTEFVRFSSGIFNNDILAGNLDYLLICIIEIAMQNNIDILRHIDLKLEYNKTRGIRHGNKIL